MLLEKCISILQTKSLCCSYCGRVTNAPPTVSVYAPRPTIVAQENTIRKLNEAGVFLVPYEEEAEEDTESSLIE